MFLFTSDFLAPHRRDARCVHPDPNDQGPDNEGKNRRQHELSNVGVLLELNPRNRPAMNFIRAVSETQGSDSGITIGEAEIFRDAAAAMGLDRVVNDLERDTRRGDLDHGDLALRHLVANSVHHPRGFQR